MRHLAVLISLLAAACLPDMTANPMPDPDDPVNPPPPPPPTDVKLTVRSGGAPVAGVKVVFQAADDTLIADVVTDATGAASATMPAGTVTVIRTSPAGTEKPADELYTYVGAKAGDQLELSLAGAASAGTVDVAVTVPTPEQPGLIAVVTPCGSGVGVAPTISLTLEGCGSETDFFVVDLNAVDENTGEQIASTFLKRAPVAPTVDLSTETYRGSLATQLSATNVPQLPANTLAISLEKRLETDLFRPITSVAGTGPTVEVDVPDLPGVEQVVAATVSYQGGGQIIAKRDPYSATPSSIDILSSALPVPSQAALVGDNLIWTEQGLPINTPDFVIAALSIPATDPLGTGGFMRAIAAPYSGTSLRIPQLPAAYAPYNAIANATVGHSLAKVTGGYDTARPLIYAGGFAFAPMGGQVTLTYTGGAGDPTEPPKP